ncbi:hypothetical protein ABPG75_006619 [Micractinium tetrahymenae]
MAMKMPPAVIKCAPPAWLPFRMPAWPACLPARLPAHSICPPALPPACPPACFHPCRLHLHWHAGSAQRRSHCDLSMRGLLHVLPQCAELAKPWVAPQVLPGPVVPRRLQRGAGQDRRLCPGQAPRRGEARLGHMRLRACLAAAAPWPAAFRGSPLVAQASSIGDISERWLTGEFGASLAAGRCERAAGSPFTVALGRADLKVVWPAASEVRGSLTGWLGGTALPAKKKNVWKPWLQPYLCRWGGGMAARERVMPHLKSYCRYRPPSSPCGAAEIAWLFVGSQNISKAAWGGMELDDSVFRIRSYELGILLLPALDAAYRSSPHCGFSCTGPGTAATSPQQPQQPQQPAPSLQFLQWQPGMQQAASMAAGPAGRGPVLRGPLPIPYALPPRLLAADREKPWAADVFFPGEDCLGRTLPDWNPRKKQSCEGRDPSLVYGLLDTNSWADILAARGY